MNLLFLGDSITDANHNFTPDCLGEGYVRILADRFPQHHFTNCGHDGFTVQHLERSLKRDCLSRNFHLATILVGINDIPVELFTDTPRIPLEFSRLYESILQQLRNASSAPLILAEPFLFDRPASYLAWKPLARRESRIIRELASQYDCFFLPLQRMFDQACLRWEVSEISPDGIHLTPLGNRLLANAWTQLAFPLLPRA